jgi:excisionase family DNA binding protein
MTEAPAAAPELDDVDVLAVNTQEACRLLDVSRRYLMELVYSGQITSVQLPSLRTGRPYAHRFEVAELRDFLKRNRRAA